MGVSRSPAELARKLQAAALIVPKGEQIGLNRAALFTKNVIQREIAQVAPGRRLRGVGRRGARVGVRYQVLGNRAYIQATGPLHLIERPTRPHTITPKKRNKSQLLRTPYGPRRRVQHPGTRGKYPWRRGVAKAQPFIPRIFKQGFFDPIERVFR